MSIGKSGIGKPGRMVHKRRGSDGSISEPADSWRLLQWQQFYPACIATGKSNAVFTTQDHSAQTYVRNTNCWTGTLDLTGASCWNSVGGATRAGTAITPRHIIFAEHFGIPNGSTVRFVKADNTVVNRTIIGQASVGPSNAVDNYATDCIVATLDSVLPDGIAIYPILPENYYEIIPAIIYGSYENGYYGSVGAFWFDQQEHALPVKASFQKPQQVICFYVNESPHCEELIVGDSGDPLFLWPKSGTLPVLLTTTTQGGAGTGPILCDLVPQIEAAIIAADVQASVSTGYCVKRANLEEIEFSPLSLFDYGINGVWYDPSDLNTMFQDSAGTTPVTAVGQPVGKILDKSGRGNHAIQPTSTKRPVLQQDANWNKYLAFDGVDDFLVTAANLNLSASDEFTSFVGTRLLRVPAVTDRIFELSESFTANNGAFVNTNSLMGITLYNHGTVAGFANANQGVSITPPLSAVISSDGKISTDTTILRVNGAVISSPTTDLGTGNYGNYPLYIGSGRGSDGTAYFLQGNIYSLIIANKNYSSAIIDSIENYINEKACAY